MLPNIILHCYVVTCPKYPHVTMLPKAPGWGSVMSATLLLLTLASSSSRIGTSSLGLLFELDLVLGVIGRSTL